MLRSLENMLGFQIAGTNGEMGTIDDFFFLDDTWTVQYLVVAAGGWLNRKKVLLSKEAVREISDSAREVFVNITKEQVYMSPDVDTDKPVTRQKEVILSEHYGWKPYWPPEGLLNSELLPVRVKVDGSLEGCNPHLRSFREITTYKLEADGPLGYVTDVIANDLGWRVDSFVVSKSRGRAIDAILAPAVRVRTIDWAKRLIQLAPDPDHPGPLPAFVATAPVNQRRALKCFDYCGRLVSSAILPEDVERVSQCCLHSRTF